VLDHPSHSLRSLAADEAIDLGKQLALRCGMAEDQCGDGNHKDDERGEGQDRVKGEGRAKAGRFMLVPCEKRIPEHGPARPKVHTVP
jgi:hypothetical protein